jgi:hypothetical protein
MAVVNTRLDAVWVAGDLDGVAHAASWLLDYLTCITDFGVELSAECYGDIGLALSHMFAKRATSAARILESLPELPAQRSLFEEPSARAVELLRAYREQMAPLVSAE